MADSTEHIRRIRSGLRAEICRLSLRARRMPRHHPARAQLGQVLAELEVQLFEVERLMTPVNHGSRISKLVEVAAAKAAASELDATVPEVAEALVARDAAEIKLPEPRPYHLRQSGEQIEADGLEQDLEQAALVAPDIAEAPVAPSVGVPIIAPDLNLHYLQQSGEQAEADGLEQDLEQVASIAAAEIAAVPVVSGADAGAEIRLPDLIPDRLPQAGAESEADSLVEAASIAVGRELGAARPNAAKVRGARLPVAPFFQTMRGIGARFKLPERNSRRRRQDGEQSDPQGLPVAQAPHGATSMRLQRVPRPRSSHKLQQSSQAPARPKAWEVPAAAAHNLVKAAANLPGRIAGRVGAAFDRLGRALAGALHGAVSITLQSGDQVRRFLLQSARGVRTTWTEASTFMGRALRRIVRSIGATLDDCGFAVAQAFRALVHMTGRLIRRGRRSLLRLARTAWKTGADVLASAGHVSISIGRGIRAALHRLGRAGIHALGAVADATPQRAEQGRRILLQFARAARTKGTALSIVARRLAARVAHGADAALRSAAVGAVRGAIDLTLFCDAWRRRNLPQAVARARAKRTELSAWWRRSSVRVADFADRAEAVIDAHSIAAVQALRAAVSAMLQRIRVLGSLRRRMQATTVGKHIPVMAAACRTKWREVSASGRGFLRRIADLVGSIANRIGTAFDGAFRRAGALVTVVHHEPDDHDANQKDAYDKIEKSVVAALRFGSHACSFLLAPWSNAGMFGQFRSGSARLWRLFRRVTAEIVVAASRGLKSGLMFLTSLVQPGTRPRRTGW
jgi:hypothetical protein